MDKEMSTGFVKLQVIEDSGALEDSGIYKGAIVWGVRLYVSSGRVYWDIVVGENPEEPDMNLCGLFTSRFKILTPETKPATIELKEKNEMKNTYVTLGDNTRAIVPQEPVIEHYSTTKGEWVALEDMATEHIMNATRKILNSGNAQVLVDNTDLHYLVFELVKRFAEMQTEE